MSHHRKAGTSRRTFLGKDGRCGRRVRGHTLPPFRLRRPDSGGSPRSAASFTERPDPDSRNRCRGNGHGGRTHSAHRPRSEAGGGLRLLRWPPGSGQGDVWIECLHYPGLSGNPGPGRCGRRHRRHSGPLARTHLRRRPQGREGGLLREAYGPCHSPSLRRHQGRGGIRQDLHGGEPGNEFPGEREGTGALSGGCHRGAELCRGILGPE